MQMRDPWYC